MKKSTQRGFSLLELSISILVAGIASVALAQMVVMAVEGQRSERMSINMQSVAMTVLDSLRIDLKFADSDTLVINGGSTPSDGSEANSMTFDTIDMGTGEPIEVTYEYTNGTGVNARDGDIVRTEVRSGVTTQRSFRNGFGLPMGINCGDPNTGTLCFTFEENPLAHANAPIKRVRINELVVTDMSTDCLGGESGANQYGGCTIMDANFGKSNFRINQSSFDIMDGMHFQ